MDILKAMEEKAFWGYEFLTWLWFLSETGGEEIELPGQEGVRIWIEEHLALEGPDTGSRENILKSGDVASGPEAGAALSCGKKVKLARFGLAQGEMTWSFTLDGATLDFKGLKIPQVDAEEEDEESPEALIYLRMGLVRRAINIIDELFTRFARLKVSAEWETTVVPEMTKWVQEKAGQ